MTATHSSALTSSIHIGLPAEHVAECSEGHSGTFGQVSRCVLKGVGYVVASVFLRYARPNEYMIPSGPALESLAWEPAAVYTLDFRQRYTRHVRSNAERPGVTLRTLDKALGEYGHG